MTNREKFEAHMETCEGCEVSMVELLTSDLAESETQAQSHIAAGRSWPALKESKEFDTQRILESPLFDRRLF